MQQDIRLDKGIRDAKLITKSYAKTFYFSSYLLGKNKRNAAFAIYALCRLSDETVDGCGQKNSLKALQSLEEKINLAYGESALDEPLLMAFRKTIRSYAIPIDYFKSLLCGMRMDTEKNRYSNFDELLTYCYNVAGVVGLIMLCIFEPKNQNAQKFAISLGIAMQLTNILRDIKEDFQRNRIYLPLEEMEQFSIGESHIRNRVLDKNFVSLLKFQIARARSFYKNSENGIRMVKDPRCRLTILAMKEIYAQILNKIETNNYDIFSNRIYVSKAEKLFILPKIFLKIILF